MWKLLTLLSPEVLKTSVFRWFLWVTVTSRVTVTTVEGDGKTKPISPQICPPIFSRASVSAEEMKTAYKPTWSVCGRINKAWKIVIKKPTWHIAQIHFLRTAQELRVLYCRLKHRGQKPLCVHSGRQSRPQKYRNYAACASDLCNFQQSHYGVVNWKLVAFRSRNCKIVQ